MTFRYFPMIASIVRFARNGVKTTQLRYESNLSFNQLQSNLELLKNNLLGMTVESSGGRIYNTNLRRHGLSSILPYPTGRQ